MQTRVELLKQFIQQGDLDAVNLIVHHHPDVIQESINSSDEDGLRDSLFRIG